MIKCAKCGGDFPATSEYFYAEKRTKSGLRAQCKKCFNQTNSEILKNNPERKRKRNLRSVRNTISRRARKLGNGCEKYSDSEVLKVYGTNCYLCDMPINFDAPRRAGEPGWRAGLHIEHFVAISQGGSDTLENVRPSHGWCNLAKGTK